MSIDTARARELIETTQRARAMGLNVVSVRPDEIRELRIVLMTLAVLAALATIWWDGHRWQSGATAVLLCFTAVACTTADEKGNDQ